MYKKTKIPQLFFIFLLSNLESITFSVRIQENNSICFSNLTKVSEIFSLNSVIVSHAN